MLDTTKKQTDSAVSRLDKQVKQIRDSVAKLENNLHSKNSKNRDAKDSGRVKDRQQRSSGRGKSRNMNRKSQTSSHNDDRKEQSEQRINDGEKYAKMMKLAEQGLSNEEIAKKLNLGRKEVELVLKLKRKNIC